MTKLTHLDAAGEANMVDVSDKDVTSRTAIAEGCVVMRPETVDLIRQEWARFAEGGVTDKELTDARTYLTGEYPLRFDGNSKIASILAGMQLVGLPADYVNTRNAKVEAVTAKDVQRVAQRLLHADQLRFVLVGRPQGIAGEAVAAPAK